MNSTHEKVEFQGAHGRLSGNLHVPEGEVRAGVVLAHCFTCSKSYKITRHLATGMENGGYAVLRFDFTGLGDSEGEFSDTSITTYVDDLQVAVRYMEQRGFSPCAAVGHSLGGAAVLLAVAGAPQIKAVVTVAAPATADHVRGMFSERTVAEALDTGAVEVEIAGRPFNISAEFFRDLERHSSLDHVAALERPILVVHGMADRTVAVSEGEQIFAAARQPRWFAAIPEADHLFTSQSAVDNAARVIVSFLEAVMPV